MRTANESSVSCVRRRFSHLLQEVRNLPSRFRIKEYGFDPIFGSPCHHPTIWRTLRIRNKVDYIIDSYRMARFYFGLNLTYQEMTEPAGLIIIPLPFISKDYAFLRYKKVIPTKHFSMAEKRLEDRIKIIKTTILNGGDEYGILKTLLSVLEEMRYGHAITKEI